MKKKLFLMFALLAGIMSAHASNGVTVDDVTIPQGGSGVIGIALNNDDYEFTAFSFKLGLPEGLDFLADKKGNPSFVAGDRYDDHSLSSSASGVFTCASFTLAQISGTSGTLLNVNVTAGADVAVGTKLNVTLSEIEFTTLDAKGVKFEDVTVSVTIGEPADTRTLLDETSTSAPSAATGVDVRVKRTIKAGEWSTLVLPFGMSTAQVKEAFGDDVQLADFSAWSSEEDIEGDIVGIEINFTAITAIEANHPCLIKVSSAVEEFTVDGVDIEVEEEPSVQVGKKKAEKGYLIGTYVANTSVPENNLFLNGNKFWYSTGATKMKAFRAYFELADVLTEMEEAQAKVRYVVGEEATDISNRFAANNGGAEGWYTLDGRRLDGQPKDKGIYITNGKKVSVK